MIKSATISSCEKYRTELRRVWGDPDSNNLMAFCGANPLVADAELDDPTIRRCISFAKREGCDGLVMVNINPFRATDPNKCPAGFHEYYAANLNRLLSVAYECAIIVCAWGSVNDKVSINAAVNLFKRTGATLYCLGKTKDGAPRHPLYLRSDAPLIPWEPNTPIASEQPLHVSSGEQAIPK